MLVEFFEGAIANSQLIDSVEMRNLPRLGEYVEFSVPAASSKLRYEIIAVEHAIEMKMAPDEIGVLSPNSNAKLLRCGLLKL